MADDINGTRQALISEQKRDLLLRTISMFANPFENINDNQSTRISPLEILPRNELYKKELFMFNKRKIKIHLFNKKFVCFRDSIS
jgi:hypothetical protein